MPHFNLHYFLETLGEKQGNEVFVVQIGAMDGKTFDPVHEYIKKFKWSGLLVEPIQEQFKRLKDTYSDNPNITFANVAIAEESGTSIMHRVLAKDVENENVPKWGLGVASFYNDRNALEFDSVKPFILQEKVQCVTLPELLKTHGISHIDILQIDTEGHDYHVLKQLDFERYHPLVINVEIVNLPKSEQTACKRLLDSYGYLYIKGGYDLLAVSPEFFTDYAC